MSPTSTTRPARAFAAGTLIAVSAGVVAVPSPAGADVEPSLAALQDAVADHPAPLGLSSAVDTPEQAGDGVALQVAPGTRVTIDLPIDAEVPRLPVPRLDAATDMFHDAESGVSMAVQPLLTGGVRILGQVGSNASPDTFRFTLGDAVASLAVTSDGGVVARDDEGDVVATVAPPWAQDAFGEPVSTRYETDGATLVQRVSHRGANHPVTFDPAIQGDCGIITCTIRLNRLNTARASDAATYMAMVGGMCATTGPIAPVCGVVLTPMATVFAVKARDFYDDGDCLKIKLHANGAAWPERLPHGEANCTDK